MLIPTWAIQETDELGGERRTSDTSIVCKQLIVRRLAWTPR